MRERRPFSRNAATAFNRLQQSGFLTADEGSRATEQHDVKSFRKRLEDACFAQFGDDAFQDGNRLRVFFANVDDGLLGANRICRNENAFQNTVRIRFHQHAIHEGAWIAFIRIADDDFVFAFGFQGHTPFFARRETTAATAAQFGGLQNLNDLFRSHGAGLFQCGETAVGAVVLQ